MGEAEEKKHARRKILADSLSLMVNELHGFSDS